MKQITSKIAIICLTFLFIACASHKEYTLPLVHENSVTDTLLVYVQKKKKTQQKALIIFQPQSEFDTESYLEYGKAWKKQGFDVYMLEYPFPDNPMQRKLSVNIQTRLYDYLALLVDVVEPDSLKEIHYLAIEYGFPFALEVSLTLKPDQLFVFEMGILPPLQNLTSVLLDHDTLSTDDSWKPNDPSFGRVEAFEMLKSVVESQNFSGVGDFDGQPETFWFEMENQNALEYLSLLKIPVHFIMPQNYHKMSKVGLQYLESMTKGVADWHLHFFNKEESSPTDVFKKIISEEK
ncbi:MAG: hypothetical protein JJU02_13755 [Cryomorphaceae bacterium]|nr:hypothetical protein [Cryomorphaceae bacterium]